MKIEIVNFFISKLGEILIVPVHTVSGFRMCVIDNNNLVEYK